MKIIFSIGDIYGIGFEVLLKSFLENSNLFEINKFAIVASCKIIKKLFSVYKNICNFSDSDLKIIEENLEIIEIKNPNFKKIENNLIEEFENNNFGIISKYAGILAFHSITEATKLVLNQQFNALVTLPVSKNSIHLSENSFIGHTQTIAEICQKKQHIMILFADNLSFSSDLNDEKFPENKSLRIALATTHIPIYSVSKRITGKKLRTLIKNFDNSLKKDVVIHSPKIAVLGLNPHASDNSMFGNEEEKVILPAIEVMKRKGVSVFGAFPADGFFASKNYLNFDGIIAMYHDQGLIPLKMLANDGGVNFTAGLPIIRTSPDHGTAFEIAGKNLANPQSMTKAINSAIKINENRINKSRK
jgi:4-hydroxythreonine-4-phosphate dehydrogenase